MKILVHLRKHQEFHGGPVVRRTLSFHCQGPGLNPYLAGELGVENGNPLQYPCLENLMNRGA